MEQISKKLKRRSTLKKNNFDYAIKNSPNGHSPKSPSILENAFSKVSTPKLPESSLPPRNSTRHHTADIAKLDQVVKLTCSSPALKKICEIPINFNSSLLSTPKSVLSPKEDCSSSYSSKVEKIATPKFDPRVHIGENKILELNSSQEISYDDLKEKFSKMPNQVSAETHEKNHTNNQLTFEVLLKGLANFGLKSDLTLVTDKNNEVKLDPCEIGKNSISFDEALAKFYFNAEVYIEANLWIKSFSECLFPCFIEKQEICSEFTDLCEKAIFFAYSGFDINNQFHLILLESVFINLQQLTGGNNWVEIGFSSNNPLDIDLSHNIAPFGLLLVLFLNDYFNNVLKNMIKFCIVAELSFISLAFDVSELALLTLRKKKLNSLMNNSQKCLEVLFFFFAGLLSQWFSLYKEFGGVKIASKKLENLAFKEQSQFINMAKNLLAFQYRDSNVV